MHGERAHEMPKLAYVRPVSAEYVVGTEPVMYVPERSRYLESKQVQPCPVREAAKGRQ